MRYKIILCMISALAALFACTSDYEVDNEPQLVVEGWIEHGGHPVVMVSTTYPVSEKRAQLSDLKDNLVRWAKVSVSCGDTTVMLMGKDDKRYFPPYIYTTGMLRGYAGNTYRLQVDYMDFHAEAETTIPLPVPLDSVRVLPCSQDTLFQIRAWFHDNPSERNYYKFFTSVGNSSLMWLSSYMQTLNDAMFTPGEEIGTTVYRGRTITNRHRYVPYFTAEDTVRVKLAQMDSISFVFWDQLEGNMSFGNFPLNMARTNPSFNVCGALGYWCGYGSTEWQVVIADSIPIALSRPIP